MSEPTHVYGQCQFKGEYGKVWSVFEEWELTDLLIPLEPGVFALDGPYHPTGEGHRGAVKEEDLLDCLNEMAQAIAILKAEFRCYGPEPGQVWDLIYAGKRFLCVPLELQPTLEALDDPLIRDYYGLEYCVVTGP